MVQDDGVLARPGLDADGSPFLSERCAYMGAPWAEHPSNAELQRLVPTLVGNGGLSLRRPAVLHRICACASYAQQGRTLFNGGLQPIPEDVFFASVLSRAGPGLLCDASLAQAFAFEERAPLLQVLGFHKPWPYLPLDVVRAMLVSMLKDARARDSR
jgi:hypothetical protein